MQDTQDGSLDETGKPSMSNATWVTAAILDITSCF